MLIFCFVLTGVYIDTQNTFGASGKFKLGSVVKSKDGRGYQTKGDLRYSYYRNDGSKKTDIMYSTSGDHRYLTVSGKKGYCVEFGIKYPSVLNTASISQASRFKYLPNGRKLGIQYAGLYGMQDSSKSVPNDIKSKCSLGDWYWATQCIMWEYQTGLRTSPKAPRNGNHFYNTLKNRPGKFAYDWMNSKIAQHDKVWSFTAADAVKAEANPIVLKWNKSAARYETTVDDSNKVDYGFSLAGNSDLHFVKNGARYTFYSAKPITGNAVLTFTKDAPATNSDFLIWSTKKYSQTMCTSGYSNSVKGYAAFTTEGDGGISIVKTSETGTVKGFTFDVLDSSGVKVLTAVTDENGTIAAELKPGEYTVREVLSEEQQKLFEQPAEQKVLIKPGEKSSVAFYNKLRTSKLILVKKDSETKEPLKGAVIGVFDSSSKELLTKEETDENGEAKFDLKVGKTYYYEELEAPLGYILDKEKHEFTINGSSDTKFELFNTAYKQPIEITKVDLENGKVLPGAEFEIMDSNGKVLFQGETGSDGKWRIDTVPLGTYYYCETKAPAGYRIDSKKYKFEIKDYGHIERISVVNQMLIESPAPKGTLKNKIKNNGVPYTGDTTTMEIYVLMTIAAAAAIIWILKVRSGRKSEKH